MTANPDQPNPEQTRTCADQNNVNVVLTPKRAKPVTENSEYAAFARRILRAYSRRVATGDVESLAQIVCLADELDDAIHHAVNGLRATGYSWAEIATRIGVTRQAAQQRWSSERMPNRND